MKALGLDRDDEMGEEGKDKSCSGEIFLKQVSPQSASYSGLHSKYQEPVRVNMVV